MNREQELRHRRNFVSQMYSGLAWQEKVAHMPTDQITAIYLRYTRSAQRPVPETPEKLEHEMQAPQGRTEKQLRIF